MLRAHAGRTHVRALEDFRGGYDQRHTTADVRSLIFFHQFIDVGTSAKRLSQPVLGPNWMIARAKLFFTRGVKRLASEECRNTEGATLDFPSTPHPESTSLPPLLPRDYVEFCADGFLQQPRHSETGGSGAGGAGISAVPLRRAHLRWF